MGSKPDAPAQAIVNAGLYVLAARDIFKIVKLASFQHLKIYVSCFEIYGGKYMYSIMCVCMSDYDDDNNDNIDDDDDDDDDNNVDDDVMIMMTMMMMIMLIIIINSLNKLSVYIIYIGKLFDLLNERHPIKCLEDSKQQVQLPGLSEHLINNVEELLSYMSYAHNQRSTGSTGANSESSRSHQIMQIVLRKQSNNNVENNKNPRGNQRSRRDLFVSPSVNNQNSNLGLIEGKLSFIDLAGSERGADTTHNNKQTRMEGMMMVVMAIIMVVMMMTVMIMLLIKMMMMMMMMMIRIVILVIFMMIVMMMILAIYHTRSLSLYVHMFIFIYV